MPSQKRLDLPIKYFEEIINKIYFSLLKKNLSDKSKEFIRNFGYLLLAEFIGSIIGFPIKILVGRFLGPEEYGNYALILNLTQFFIIPMIFGLTTAAIKYISSKEDKEKYILSIFALNFITVTISSIALIILKKPLLLLFNIPEHIFWWTLIFSIVYSLYYLADSMIRGLQKFKLVFSIAILNSSVLLLVFLFNLFIRKDNTYSAFISANIACFVFSFLIYASVLYLRLKGKMIISFKKIKEILPYTSWAIIGSITGVIIGNTNSFFLNTYSSLLWVGIYMAYVNGANLFVGRAFALFLQVYFPTISAEKQKGYLVNKVTKILLIGFFPIVLISALTIYIALLLFGSEFPILIGLIILFSLNNFFFVANQSYMWLLNSQGVIGLRKVTLINIIASVISLILFFFLIKEFGIYGSISAIILVNVFLTILFYINAKSFARRGKFNE